MVVDVVVVSMLDKFFGDLPPFRGCGDLCVLLSRLQCTGRQLEAGSFGL